MSFCAKCGATVEEKYKFCSACGFPVKDLQAELIKDEPQVIPPPTVGKSTAPSVTPMDQPQAPAKDPNKPLSAAAYFWLIMLYVVPVIGFISCIFISFLATNKNLKNFSLGFLIFFIVDAIFAVIGLMIVGSVITYIVNILQSYVIGLTVGTTGDILKTVFEILYWLGQQLGYYPG